MANLDHLGINAFVVHALESVEAGVAAANENSSGYIYSLTDIVHFSIAISEGQSCVHMRTPETEISKFYKRTNGIYQGYAPNPTTVSFDVNVKTKKEVEK